MLFGVQMSGSQGSPIPFPGRSGSAPAASYSGHGYALYNNNSLNLKPGSADKADNATCGAFTPRSHHSHKGSLVSAASHAGSMIYQGQYRRCGTGPRQKDGKKAFLTAHRSARISDMDSDGISRYVTDYTALDINSHEIGL